MLGRSRSLQIYMKPGIKEDDLMLRVWEACRRHDRPQDVFRSMLRAGMMAMLESGEMPESVIDECGLEALLERRRRRSRHTPEPQPTQPTQPLYAPYPYPHPAAHPAVAQAPHPHAPQWTPAPPPAPVAQPRHEAETTQPLVPARQQEAAREAPRTALAPRSEVPSMPPQEPAGGKKQGKGKIGDLM